MDVFPGKNRGREESPGFQAGGCLESQAHPSCFGFSFVTGSEQSEATSQWLTSQRSPIPPSICTSQFTSQQAHGQICEQSVHALAPSTLLALICLALCSHASQPPCPCSLTQLLLRLKGRETKSQTHAEFQSLKRGICGGNQILVVCVSRLLIPDTLPS